MGAYRVLVVEDDPGLRDVLARGLRAEDFEVVTACDGASALRTAEGAFDAVVLDIGLPDSDGRDVCQAMRGRGVNAPVIFLTARGDVGDRLSGFASGGDDYVTKPFVFPELAARVTAAARRNRRDSAGSAPVSRELRVDPLTHALHFRGREAMLSPIEYRLMARLLASPDAVVRRRQLREAGWPIGGIVSDNTLDQYVSKLRRRLVEVESPAQIRTARGVGFRLE